MVFWVPDISGQEPLADCVLCVTVGIGADMCEWAAETGYDGDAMYGDWIDNM